MHTQFIGPRPSSGNIAEAKEAPSRMDDAPNRRYAMFVPPRTGTPTNASMSLIG